VAIALLLLDHVPPDVGDNVVVAFMQMVELPVILTVGNGFTVIVTVWHVELPQPFSHLP